MAQETREELDFFMSQLKILSERLQDLEEEKQRDEDLLKERIQILSRTCESQSHTLATQQDQLQAQERRLLALEKQNKNQEQRIKNQEYQLEEQAQRLEQQDDLLSQHTTLHAERAQQAELQEKMLGQHKVLLSDLLVASQAADQAIRSVTASQAERRQAKAEESEDITTRSLAGSVQSASRLAVPAAHLSMSAGQLPLAVGTEASNGHGAASVSGLSRSSLLGSSPVQKKSGVLWEKVLQLCEETRHLEAYKQVIAEPEESCLLRLMQHTGPIVERLDAESNSRLIRRLIHILSSPTKEPAAHSIEHIFAWLWQALKAGIHFTASQVEDLASALQRVSAPHSPLPAQERAEASQLLARVSALRRS